MQLRKSTTSGALSSAIAPATPAGQPFSVGTILPEFLSGIGICENNVVEENTVIGNADGFIVEAGLPGEICRNNIIRRNTVIGQRVFTPEDNGSMVWLAGPGVTENLIKENVLRGSEGLGIIVEEGSGNRIIENKFKNLPGEKDTENDFPGTAIFLGEPTTGNRVLRNEFKNVVNAIVDLGTGNIIRGDDDHNDKARADVVQRSRTLDNSKLRFLRDRIKH